jgi:tetratricopeptide (TPR) repeat protein
MKQVRYLSMSFLFTAAVALAQIPSPGNGNIGAEVGPVNKSINETQRLQKPATKPQQVGAQQDKSGQAPAAPAVPAGKRQPQAKTKEEFDAYSALVQMTDAAAMEKASDEFVTKFPDSELKGAVYQRTMATYQTAGNDDKTIEMGHKAISYNPDDPAVLVSMAELIAGRTRETDLDKDDRLAEATKYANHALETVTDFPAPPTLPADQVARIKDEMRGSAYSALGMVAFTNKKYPDSIANFTKSIEVTKDNPDPTVFLRLTLAYDKAAQYPQALDMAKKTLALQNVPPQVTQLATQEKNRLEKLASAPKPTAGAAPTSPQPQAVQPH